MTSSVPLRPARGPLRRLLQIATFARKEAIDVLRQPRLLVVLVLGPFALLAAFAVGYRDEPPTMRTLFVIPEGSPFEAQVQQFADELEDYVDYRGATADAVDARAQLERGEVDLVVTFPEDPLETVLGNEQAPITVVHTRLDPIERTAINFSSELAVGQINSQILAAVLGAGQERAVPAGELIGTARDAVAGLRTAATAAGGSGADEEAYERSLAELESAVAALERSVQSSDLVSEQLTGAGLDGDGASVLTTLAELREGIADVRADPDGADAASLDALDEQLAAIDEQYRRFAEADPQVLVRPFRAEVQIAVERLGSITDWYAPAAVVLMMQQFGVAFGALSFVRERQLGIVDVFRIAPVGAPAAVIGKYLAYLVIGGVIGAALMSLVVLALDVPVQSGLAEVVIVMGLALFASVGLGFVISLAAANDAQAVQYTMLTLLASLFFSGFFLSIGQMEGVARAVGYLLPVTYGMDLLRSVMLRGDELDVPLTLGLAGYGVAMFALATLGARRRMSTTVAT